MSVRPMVLDETNFRPAHPAPAVVVGYEVARFGDEHAKQARLERVTATLFFAMDAALRGNPASVRMRATLDGVSNDSKEKGLPHARTAYPKYVSDSNGVKDLLTTSAKFASGLLEPVSETYAISGSGTPDGGINKLGNNAVSQWFNGSSPQRTGKDDYHWYKTTAQMVDIGPGSLAVGVYANAQQQILSAITLDKQLKDPALITLLGRRQAGVWISEHQPATLKNAKYSLISNGDGSELPNTVRLPGLNEYIDSLLKKDPTLGYVPFVTSKYGTSAVAALFSGQLGIGLKLAVEAYPADSSETVRVVPQDEQITVVNAHNEATGTLGLLSLSIEPIISLEPGSSVSEWFPMRQDENVIYDTGRMALAAEFNDVVDGIHDLLLNAA